MRVLVIEDEAALRDDLSQHLRQAGYSVDIAPDGEEGLYLAGEVDFDIAIVDLGLPGISGFDVIASLRSGGQHFPVLILTARGQWQDKVRGLESGADDYLAKPFHIEELLARVNALVRRSSGWSTPLLDFGELTIDTTAQLVKVDGAEIELTAYEYRLLEYLALHAGEVVSRTGLTEHIYEQDYDRDSNVIEVFIGRLRRKLDPDNRLRPIETMRGRGYRFRLDPCTR